MIKENSMSIITSLKKLRLSMRKENPKAYATLSNVIGDFELKSKLKINIGNPEDELAVRVIRQEISDLNEQIKTLKDNSEIESILGVIEMLQAALPKNLTSSEVETIMKDAKEKGMNFPLFMKHMKDTYFGRYDGKEVSKKAKEFF